MNVLPTSADRSSGRPGIFDAIDFDGLKSIVVAVSGGSDSLALLYKLLDFRRSRSAFPAIIAVTVDHGLRAQSREEALYVASLCRAAGIAHRILPWVGPKPESGISARAREMRYGLLCEAARACGSTMILTGHTLDDQIETLAMRSARMAAGGSGRGLAGMAPATLLEREIWLVRPLLQTARGELRAYLGAIGIGWRDDPSNESMAYERVRVRKALRPRERQEMRGRLIANRAARISMNARVAAALPSCTRVVDGLCAEIERRGWDRLDTDVRHLAIGVLLASMGGKPLLPAASLCQKALALTTAGEGRGRLALSGCVVDARAERILIYREMRSIAATVVEPGRSLIWDGRYRIGNDGKRPVEIRAAGMAGRRQGSGRHAAWLRSGPALLADGAAVSLSVPEDHAKLPDGIAVARHLALFDIILSGYDADLAQSIAKIFQVQAYRHSPVNQINKN